jgi:hypothetical protein
MVVADADTFGVAPEQNSGVEDAPGPEDSVIFFLGPTPGAACFFIMKPGAMGSDDLDTFCFVCGAPKENFLAAGEGNEFSLLSTPAAEAPKAEKWAAFSLLEMLLGSAPKVEVSPAAGDSSFSIEFGLEDCDDISL